jgi:Holliday junction DNA helicase RuvA
MIIGKLKGVIDSLFEDHLILMVQGVGYTVFAPSKTLSRFEVGEAATLFIEHIIREDHQQLCGFAEESERGAFKTLLGVQGVGVRVALSLLSVLTSQELAEAIINQDKTLLSRADGVGPKLAGRLVLELKDKVSAFLGAGVISSLPRESIPSFIEDAIQGLVSLGYNRYEASQVVNTVKNAHPEAKEAGLIRLSLQKLSKV